jgi:hypothetical protein
MKISFGNLIKGAAKAGKHDLTLKNRTISKIRKAQVKKQKIKHSRIEAARKQERRKMLKVHKESPKSSSTFSRFFNIE